MGLGIQFRGDQEETKEDKTQRIFHDADVDLPPTTWGGDIGQPTPLSQMLMRVLMFLLLRRKVTHTGKEDISPPKVF